MGQWGTVPSGDCFVLSIGISSSVLGHCANAAIVMTHTVLYVIQRREIDRSIFAHSIWWWKLPPTIMSHWFLKEFSKDEKNAKDFYKLYKISWKVSGFFSLLHFFLWKVGFLFRGTSSWETAEYPILFLIQVLGMSHLQLSFPSCLVPELFRNAAVSDYSVLSYLGWPFVSKSLPTIKNRFPFSSLSLFSF